MRAGVPSLSSAQLPASSTALLEKLSAWEMEQQAALEAATEKKRADVASILRQHLTQAAEAGDVAGAQAIGKEIERLTPAKPEARAYPGDAVEFQGHHYKIYPDLLTWEAAKQGVQET